jgi:DNA recombination protein RmuC
METVVLVVLCTVTIINLFITVIRNKSGREQYGDELKGKLDIIEHGINKTDSYIRDEFSRNREELNNTLKNLTQLNEQKMEKLRETVENKLNSIQEDNSKKLEKMRETVDEKLNNTLEKRLGESFKLVSERLEQVHKGLGEMQSLANGVGDLKKVLTNVKIRGSLGEFQLEAILEQILSPEQYVKNAATNSKSAERVEFAIKMPGRKDDDSCVLLPLDSKFPIEDYQKLLKAYDIANIVEIEEATKNLEIKIKFCAKTIKEKYINPPETTDFAVMFLPVEGLYAEVLRRPGLFETLQRDYKIAVVGPTTLAAFLNSLRLGFKTLAIEKRSSEVWGLLGAIKTEFGRFGGFLEKTHKKLQEASNNIDLASRKSRTIERKLRSVQELPSDEAVNLLGMAENDEEEEDVETD